MANVLANRGEQQEAVALAGFVLHHPACEQWTKDQGEQLLSALNAVMPAEEFDQLLEAGAANNLDRVLTEVLGGRPG